MDLTVGMATYRDFDGVYFTLQALRLYQDMEGVEVVVVDNFGCEATRSFVEDSVGGRYILSVHAVGTSAPRDLVFREARGEAVLCLDSHVLLGEGVLARLRRFYRDHPDCLDLLQGPLVDDNLKGLSSHFDPVWSDQMWGVWALDPRGRASTLDSGASEVKRGTSTRSSATSAGAACACHGYGGFTGSAGRRVRRTRSGCKTGSLTI
jgi:Glycosyl transferase family 2